MKKGKSLEKYLNEFYDVTSKASEITRNLSIASIAIIWLFKNPEGSKKLLDPNLIIPLKWVVISLIIDLFQYVYLSFCIKLFHRHYERKLLAGEITEKQSENLLYPAFLENITLIFFVAKITTMVTGYYYIYSFLLTKM